MMLSENPHSTVSEAISNKEEGGTRKQVYITGRSHEPHSVNH